MKYTVQACAECDCPTIPSRVYDHSPELRETHARRGAQGMCATCYQRSRVRILNPDRPAPTPRGPHNSWPRPCNSCDRPMVPESRRTDEKVVRHKARGLCSTCYSRLRKRGQLPPEPALDPAEPARLRTAVGLTPGADRQLAGEVHA